MLLFELFENTNGKKNTVVYAFGRFNPPNAGHQRLVNALKRKASEVDGDWYLFISPRDADPKNNPLTGQQKLDWWRAIMPQDARHFIMDPAIPMSDFAAQWLYDQGYNNAMVMYGAGEQAMRFPIALNGAKFSKKGMPLRTSYNFNKFVDGGTPKSSDSEGIKGDPDLRSTDIRALVANNDRDGFFRASGINPDIRINGLDYFETLADAMHLTNK